MTQKTKQAIAGLITGAVILTAFFGWLLSVTVLAEAPTDYMDIMLQAVADCDPETGHWAEAQRNEKIRSLGLDYAPIAWDELDLLARIVWQEAGSDGISQAWRWILGGRKETT